MVEIKSRIKSGPFRFSLSVLQDILFLLYMVFLPFLRYGFRIYYYTFTISDFLLGILFLTVLYEFLKFRLRLDREIRIFFLLFGLLLAAFSLSLIRARNIRDGILDLLAYIYAGFVIFSFAVYLFKNHGEKVKLISPAVILSLLILSAGSFLWLVSPASRFYLSTPGPKYAFFLRNPNQLSMLAIVYFCIFLVFFSGKKNKWNLFILSMPALFLNIYLNTGSRAAFIVGGMLILVFYFILSRTFITEIRRGAGRRIGCFLFSFFCIALTLYLHLAVFKSWTSQRAFSVFFKNEQGQFSGDIEESGDMGSDLLIRSSGDIIRREINAKALQVFKEHPVFGIGLGNFKNNYHVNEIHNSFLSILTESGIVGLAFLLLIFLFLLRLFMKYRGTQFLEYSAILGCVLLFNWIHYVLRERWVWLFVVFLVVASIVKDRSLDEPL